jgi:hypothetical protein
LTSKDVVDAIAFAGAHAYRLLTGGIGHKLPQGTDDW